MPGFNGTSTGGVFEESMEYIITKNIVQLYIIQSHIDNSMLSLLVTVLFKKELKFYAIAKQFLADRLRVNTVYGYFEE